MGAAKGSCLSDQHQDRLEPRPSEPVVMTEIVFPQDTNPRGTMFGGAAYAMMDKAAGIAAMRFSRTMAVTAASERVEFTIPIHHGMIVEVIARVIHAGSTSMVVEAELFCQEPLEETRRRATVGYFTMVAVDADGRPCPVPPLLVEGADANAKWALGEEIRLAAKLRRERDRR
jgi:acyl-CoA hydrolase